MITASRPPHGEEVPLIAFTITYDHVARRRSYELLAEAFEVAGAVPARGAVS
jgi:hypothetical protein